MKTTEQQNKDFEEALGAIEVDYEAERWFLDLDWDIMTSLFEEMSEDDLSRMKGLHPIFYRGY